jgi:hypothetical protein
MCRVHHHYHTEEFSGDTPIGKVLESFSKYYGSTFDAVISQDRKKVNKSDCIAEALSLKGGDQIQTPDSHTASPRKPQAKTEKRIPKK